MALKIHLLSKLVSDILSLGPFGPTFGSRVISEK